MGQSAPVRPAGGDLERQAENGCMCVACVGAGRACAYRRAKESVLALSPPPRLAQSSQGLAPQPFGLLRRRAPVQQARLVTKPVGSSRSGVNDIVVAPRTNVQQIYGERPRTTSIHCSDRRDAVNDSRVREACEHDHAWVGGGIPSPSAPVLSSGIGDIPRGRLWSSILVSSRTPTHAVQTGGTGSPVQYTRILCIRYILQHYLPMTSRGRCIIRLSS